MDAKTDAGVKAGKLILGDKNWSFPLYNGTIGPQVLDVGKLYSQTGSFTYDPGFMSTASWNSRSPTSTATKASCSIAAIRSISSPSTAISRDLLPAALRRIADRWRRSTISTIDVSATRWCTIRCCASSRGSARRPSDGGVGRLVSARLPPSTTTSTDIPDPAQRIIASLRMIAKMPTLAAMAYKYNIGQPFVYPKNDLTDASNFLRMCFAVPCED